MGSYDYRSKVLHISLIYPHLTYVLVCPIPAYGYNLFCLRSYCVTLFNLKKVCNFVIIG